MHTFHCCSKLLDNSGPLVSMSVMGLLPWITQQGHGTLHSLLCMPQWCTRELLLWQLWRHLHSYTFFFFFTEKSTADNAGFRRRNLRATQVSLFNQGIWQVPTPSLSRITCMQKSNKCICLQSEKISIIFQNSYSCIISFHKVIFQNNHVNSET